MGGILQAAPRKAEAGESEEEGREVSTRDVIELFLGGLILLQLRGISNQLTVLLTKFDYVHNIRGMEWADGGTAKRKP
jgi:hypothetical protein